MAKSRETRREGCEGMTLGKGRGGERLSAYSKGEIGVGVYLGERRGR